MQVTAAQARQLDANHGVGGFFDGRIRQFTQTDPLNRFKADASHRHRSFRFWPRPN